MRRSVGLVLVIIMFAGCSIGTAASAPPTASAVASPPAITAAPASASLTPSPTTGGTPDQTAASSPFDQASGEAILLGGVRKDANVGCAAQKSDLPAGAVAGVECHARPDLVTSAGFYLFNSQDELLATYFALLAGQNVQQRKGDCFGAAAGEDAYQPGDGAATFIAEREGCFVHSDRATYLATIAGEPVADAGYTFGGPFVLVILKGTGANPGRLRTWAWLGNQAAPGSPTIWNAPG